jgi:hypothetical protein
MVRAILEGRKTQTRRIVKTQPCAARGYLFNGNSLGRLGLIANTEIKCPYGVAGDRLWVKETFGFSHQDDDINQKERVVYYRAGHPHHVTDSGIDSLKYCQSGCLMEPNHYVRHPDVWKPSIFMPRWASRITLEIVSTRIERLNEISEEDAKAEGVKGALVSEEGVHCAYKTAYAVLWDEINGKGAGASNPWVWVVEFKKVEVAK